MDQGKIFSRSGNLVRKESLRTDRELVTDAGG